MQAVDTALVTLNKAVTQGVPGYVLSTGLFFKFYFFYLFFVSLLDMTTAYAFIHPPNGAAIQSLSSSPATALKLVSAGALTGGWVKYQVTGIQTGRSRLTITYSDGSIQTVQYPNKIIQ